MTKEPLALVRPRRKGIEQRAKGKEGHQGRQVGPLRKAPNARTPGVRPQLAGRQPRRDADGIVRAGVGAVEAEGAVHVAELAGLEEPQLTASEIGCWRLGIALAEKQEILETLDVKERLERVTRLLTREMELLEVAQRIQTQARSEIDKGQREYYLRQQMKAIRKELGETDSENSGDDDYADRIEKADMTEEALERMTPRQREAWSLRLGVEGAGRCATDDELARELIRRQRDGGSWANRFTDAREDDPLVATPWAAAAR